LENERDSELERVEIAVARAAGGDGWAEHTHLLLLIPAVLRELPNFLPGGATGPRDCLGKSMKKKFGKAISATVTRNFLE